MRIIALLLLSSLLIFGCVTPEPIATPTPSEVLVTPNPSLEPTLTPTLTPTAIPTQTPIPSVSPTLAPTLTPLPTTIPSVIPSPTLTPTVVAIPSPTPVAGVKELVSGVSVKVKEIALKHFGKTNSFNAYSPDYDSFAVSDATSRYKFDVFIRKAKYTWGEYDYLTPINSTPSNRTVNAYVVSNPASAYYGYDFRMLCFKNSVELDVQTREYSLTATQVATLGKTFASLIAEVCEA